MRRPVTIVRDGSATLEFQNRGHSRVVVVWTIRHPPASSVYSPHILAGNCSHKIEVMDRHPGDVGVTHLVAVRERGPERAGVPPAGDIDLVECSQRALANQPLHCASGRPVSVVLAGHQYAARPGRGIDQQLRVLHGCGERFLDQDMLTRLRRSLGHFAVRPFRGHHQHGIHSCPGQSVIKARETILLGDAQLFGCP